MLLWVWVWVGSAAVAISGQGRQVVCHDDAAGAVRVSAVACVAQAIVVLLRDQQGVIQEVRVGAPCREARLPFFS